MEKTSAAVVESVTGGRSTDWQVQAIGGRAFGSDHNARNELQRRRSRTGTIGPKGGGNENAIETRSRSLVRRYGAVDLREFEGLSLAPIRVRL